MTIEEGAIGGLGAHVLTLRQRRRADRRRPQDPHACACPTLFQDHDKPDKQYDAAGLNAPQIVETVLKALRHNSAGVKEARA